MAFAPDGRTLATTSADQTVRLWELPGIDSVTGDEVGEADEVREACSRGGGTLDQATWELYAPGVNYYDTCADH